MIAIRHRRTVTVAAVSSVLLVVGAASPVAYAEPAGSAKHATMQKIKPVPVHAAGSIKSAPVPSSSRSALPTRTLLSATTDTVVLAAGATVQARTGAAGRGSSPVVVSGAWKQLPNTSIEIAPATTSTTVARGQAATITVQTLSDGQARQFGLSGLVMRVTRTGGTASRVGLRVPAAVLAALGGADYASRVRWVQTSPNTGIPATVGARALIPVASTGQSSTTVLTPAIGAHPVLVAATTGATGSTGTGSWSASPLNQASSWQVSAQSGDFSWSDPLTTPPAAAGPAPAVAVSYDSQLTDGETGSTNNQPSDVGEGWSLAGGGSISRVYTGCAVNDRSGASAISGSGDLCWDADNARASFAGHSGDLVRNSDGSWHFADDDGTRVQYLTGGSNGTADGDYWKLTTTDGTQYFFGLNILPGASAAQATHSADTVPVCGNASTVCTGTRTTETPFATQAWRWNLDYVVDPHGNAEVLKYSQQTNRYAEKGSGSVSFVRGSELTEIDYGLRSSNLWGTNAASDKVLFAYGARCESGVSGEPANACSTTPPAAANYKYWPDVPWDQNCTSTTSCTQTSPTFFSSTMLTTVTTEVLSGSSYAAVNSWALSHSWPPPGDGTSAALWLTQIVQTGHTSGSGTTGAATIALPATKFTGTTRQNRVDTANGLAPLDKWRISGITLPTGGTITVYYSAQQCTPSIVSTLSPQKNTDRCFPAWWTPQSTPAQAAGLDWFHKYVVTSVVQSPATTAVDDVQQETDYLYSGAAWRFNTAAGMDDSQRTWSVWAGYADVEIRHGDPNKPALMTTTDYRYFQGLDGDPDGSLTNPTSTTRSVELASGVPDSVQFAGRVYEQSTRLGSSGGAATSTTPVLSDTIDRPWTSAATATSARSYSYTDPTSHTTYTATLTNDAYYTGDGVSTTTEPLSTGGNRTETTTTTNDAAEYGVVTRVENSTSDAGTTCTATSYAQNTTDWLIDYPARVTVTGKACGASLTYPASTTVSGADIISDTITDYDGGTDGAAPSKGEVTATKTAIGYSGSTPTWRTTATSTYDALGRLTSTTDPNAAGGAATTTTAYTPAATGPLTSTTVTNPKGWTTTTTLNPAWGATVSQVDANANTTTATYDALGRRAQVWLPNRPQASYSVPSLAYAYAVNTTKASSIATTAVNGSGGTLTSYTLLDGLGATIQTQAPAETGGIDIVDTGYDAAGRTVMTTASYYATGTASGTLLTPVATIPSQTQTAYDGAGRVTASILVGYAAEGATPTASTEAWRTSTRYLGADRTDTVPPTGGTPTTTITNSRGKTTRLIQYLSAAIGGTTETTSYGYDPLGDMTSMTNPAGSAWSWTYNLLGQQISATDPATGTTTTSYTADGQTAATTDDAGATTSYTYDLLGRKTGQYTGAASSGVETASWSYDSATAGRGQPASSTSYTGGTAGQPGTGTAYTAAVSGYTSLGSPTASTTTIGGTTPLAGSYTTSYTYNAAGGLQYQTDPAEGGLPKEKLEYGTDIYGNPDGLSSGTDIYGIFSYDALGQVGEINQYNTGEIWQTLTYNTVSGRLLSKLAQRNVSSGNAEISYDHYTYDNAGDLTEDNDTNANTDQYPGPGTDTQCFSYDHQQNLTQAWTPADSNCTETPSSSNLGSPAAYWTSYTVDPATGNRTSSVEHATTATGTDTRDTYTYPASTAVPASGTSTTETGGPTALSTITHASAPAGTNPVSGTWTTTGTGALTYNADGSATSQPGQKLTYNAQGQLITTAVTAGADNGTSQTNTYTADGTLLLQTDAVTGTTAYLGDSEITVAPDGTIHATRTYADAGYTLAERDCTTSSAGTLTSNAQYYLVTDQHQTVTSQTSDDATMAITYRWLDPYGNPRAATITTTPVPGTPASWPSINSFLNKAQNTLTSSTTTPTITLGARQYDPTLGRFTTPDPVLDTTDPQQTNGYSYADNNPVTHSDPH